jgi:beta-glucuronidase
MLNGQVVGNHTGGHLPFEFEVTSMLRFGEQNRLDVAVNNTLSHTTIPQADLDE